MASILDYVYWRGDLSLNDDHFNHIDAAVLSQLVMIDFTKVVHKNHFGISIEDAYAVYQKHHDVNKKLGLVINEKIMTLFKVMSESNRYKEWKLSYYKKVYDEENHTQFAALTVQIMPGISVIVYSGTDDTLSGWFEDLGMMYQKIPSYDIAYNYMMHVIKYHLDDIIIVGHSKGGALAIHSTLNLEGRMQKKLLQTYCFDCPGMDFHLYQEKKYHPRWKKVVSFIPEMAVVGQLFNHNEKQYVVKSKADLLFQHDVFTWEVLGKDFLYEFGVSEESIYLRYKFHHVIDKMSIEDRIFLVDSLFKLFKIANCKTLTDVSNNRKKVITSVMKLSKEERGIIHKYIVVEFLRDRQIDRIFFDLITKKRKFKLKDSRQYIEIK